MNGKFTRKVAEENAKDERGNRNPRIAEMRSQHGKLTDWEKEKKKNLQRRK